MVMVSGGGTEQSLAVCPASSRKRSSGPGGQTMHGIHPQPELTLVNPWTMPRGTLTIEPGPVPAVFAVRRAVGFSKGRILRIGFVWQKMHFELCLPCRTSRWTCRPLLSV